MIPTSLSSAISVVETDFSSCSFRIPRAAVAHLCRRIQQTQSGNAYRCQVGHAWTAEALLLAYDDELEETVWAAVRILKEKAALSCKLAENARGAADLERYSASANQADHAIAVLGQGLFTHRSYWRDTPSTRRSSVTSALAPSGVSLTIATNLLPLPSLRLVTFGGARIEAKLG